MFFYFFINVFVLADFAGREFDSGVQNVIFVHGFLSSSSFWVDTVLPRLSKEVRSSHRLFAVDVLGFGKSPRPDDSLYTNADHVEMIRR
jgi:pimeloyl-ACP methyl ester carboxylesterase